MIDLSARASLETGTPNCTELDHARTIVLRTQLLTVVCIRVFTLIHKRMRQRVNSDTQTHAKVSSTVSSFSSSLLPFPDRLFLDFVFCRSFLLVHLLLSLVNKEDTNDTKPAISC